MYYYFSIFLFFQNRRGMTKQLRDLEAELDEERKQKTAAMTIKKVKQNLISRKKIYIF